jgi:AraC-like DNA-binding protein
MALTTLSGQLQIGVVEAFFIAGAKEAPAPTPSMPRPEAGSRRVPETKKSRISRRAKATTDRPGVIQEGDFRIATLMPVPGLLRELNCDPGTILAKVGLDPALFEKPDHRVPFATGGALLEECAAASGVPHFGLLAGARFELSMLGVLGELMCNSDSVRAALLQFVRHLHLNDRGAVTFLLNLDHEEISIGYGVYRHDTPGISKIYDMALAIGMRIMRTLCGPAWKPVRVSFARGIPEDAAPYRRYFHAPVHFDSPHSELVFSARWLDRPLASPDQSHLVAAERIALEEEQGGDGKLVERVRRAIQGLVITGEASSQRISARLGIHERVLRRRLLAQGSSIHQLIGAARFEWARQLLGDTHLTLAEIASALGYSDATAFSRAFRNWADMTPGAWRSRAEAAAARAVVAAAPAKASPRKAKVPQKIRTRSKT